MFDRQQSIRDAVSVNISSTDHAMPPNKPTRAVYVGVGGILVVQLADNPGVDRSYTVQSGSRHPLQVVKFVRQGTTASGLMAEF